MAFSIINTIPTVNTIEVVHLQCLEQLRVGLPPNQHILTLEITVDDVVRVKILECFCHLKAMSAVNMV